MTQTHPSSTGALWARFRFSVVGSLLSSPPARGRSRQRSAPCREDLVASCDRARCPRSRPAPSRAGITWRSASPTTRSAPCAAPCARTVARISLAPAIAERLHLQYRDHPDWSYQLHYDNLAALCEGRSFTGAAPLLFHGQALHAGSRPGAQRASAQRTPWRSAAEERRQTREVRSYEAEYVGALWHLDFHHGSKKVLTPGGQWLRPIALGILDDHSRLCCHVQWYLSETAEDLVHGLSQAIQKRGLPRALLTDNGSAMVAEEVTEGLLRLGIVHERTLPYSPYQNGKQESFWGTLEGRLMNMLDGVADLTLELLNKATQAWVEIEYNRAVHRETACSPVDRFTRGPDVLRYSPSSESLRRRVSAGNQENSAAERWHDLAGRGAVRDSGTVPPLPRSDRALRPLGPRPGRSGRRAQWDSFWLPSILSTKPPTPMAAVPRSSPAACSTCRRRRHKTRGDHSRAAAPLETHPPRVLGHRHATGLFAQDIPRRQRRTIMNSKKLLALYGLKWNPFSPELPSEALLATPKIEHFAWRVEQLVQEGGFALITGESGTGKSVALRIVAGPAVCAA